MHSSLHRSLCGYADPLARLPHTARVETSRQLSSGLLQLHRLPLVGETVFRPMTDSAETLEGHLMSSVMPSEKYSCSDRRSCCLKGSTADRGFPAAACCSRSGHRAGREPSQRTVYTRQPALEGLTVDCISAPRMSLSRSRAKDRFGSFASIWSMPATVPRMVCSESGTRNP